jgi:hypothetical protein
LLWDSFQAKACSLPPEPSKSMFMVSDDGDANIGKNIKDDEVCSEKNKMVYFER